ncbi:MAG: transposase [Bacteroidota bacterium]
MTKIAQFGVLVEHIDGGKIYHILCLCCCIIRCRSCNLNQCKVEHASVSGETLKLDTVYSRFKRIFQTGRGDKICKSLFIIVLHLVYPYIEPILVVDRTEFTIGKKWVNLLVYGVVCHGVFIPLVWKDLGERKSSSQKERLALLDKLLAWWRASKLPLPTLSLLGDREFIGQQWLMALDKRGLKFVIRLKSNLKFHVWHKGRLREKKVKVRHLARYLKRKKENTCEIVLLEELIVNFVCVPNEDKNAKEQFVYLITNLENPLQAVSLYRKRWKIECCFKHLKSNGFDLESTALEGTHKQEILFAILTLAYVLAIREGILNQYEEQVPIRTFKNGKAYRKKSLFLFGFEIFKPKADTFLGFARYFRAVIWDVLKHFKYKYLSYI